MRCCCVALLLCAAYTLFILHMQLNTLDLATGKVTKLAESLGNALAMANGTTNFPGTDDSIAMLTQGKGDWQPGAVNKLNLRTLKHEVLLDNYLGRQFNSPNDIAFYKDGRTLFFTDPPYGFAQNFKLQPHWGTTCMRTTQSARLSALRQMAL
jgi:gluconolactonase